MTDPITYGPGSGPAGELADHPRARHKLRHVFDDRLRQRSAAFAALDAATQDRPGRVDPGDTPDMVHIAIGLPKKPIDVTTADGRESTWVYVSFSEEYAGTRQTGYRRTVIEDKDTKRSVVRVEPAYRDVYPPRAEEYIRLIFKNGRVAAIEQTQTG